jgi:hypothetical protein
VGAAELAHGVVELLGLLEIADWTRGGDHDELRVWDRLTRARDPGTTDGWR